MTEQEVILMADASGLSYYGMGKDRAKFIHYLEKFAELVAAHEREECAKVARQISDIYRWHCYGNEVDTADEIAEAIRARGTT